MLYTTHTVLSNALQNLGLLSERIAIFKGSQVLMILLKCEHMLIELFGCYKNLSDFYCGRFFHAFSRYFIYSSNSPPNRGHKSIDVCLHLQSSSFLLWIIELLIKFVNLLQVRLFLNESVARQGKSCLLISFCILGCW